MTKVINLNHKPRPPREDYVYIGRSQWAGKEYFKGSKWGNYYLVSRYRRDGALERYEAKVRNGPLWDDLPQLDGKILACWCAPARCHGHVLLALLEERKKGERDEYKARS